MPKQIRIAVVGLNFGSHFLPIYQSHPDVAQVGVCEINEALLQSVADRFNVSSENRFTRLEYVLDSGRFDAVHLLTPVPVHVEQELAVLNAGLHCACAVPMATDLDGLRQVIAAQRRSGKNYMMMETAVYTREFLYAREMHSRGELGKLTFLRSAYFQDLEGDYPKYWWAQPPMHYATHAVAPVLAIAGARAEKVCCFGSGRLRSDIQQPGGNIFPLETAIFQLAGTDIAAEVTKSWFQTAREWTETFSVYGDRRAFEWPLMFEEPIIFDLEPLKSGQRGRSVGSWRVHVPDRADLLPAALTQFTDSVHGGSHPHLVHEFVRSIVEERPPAIDVITAADWCAPGICAHESALRGGEPVEIPDFNFL